MPLFGLLLVTAVVVVDQSSAVAVFDGIGDVAEPVARECDGFDGEVFRRRQGVVGIDGRGDVLEPKFVDGVLRVRLVDGSGLGHGGGGERVVGDAVDGPGQSSGGLEEGLHGGWLEQRRFASGEVRAVGEILVELVALEAADVVSDDESLAQRFVHGHGESAPRFGESDEE